MKKFKAWIKKNFITLVSIHTFVALTFSGFLLFSEGETLTVFIAKGLGVFLIIASTFLFVRSLRIFKKSARISEKLTKSKNIIIEAQTKIVGAQTKSSSKALKTSFIKKCWSSTKKAITIFIETIIISSRNMIILSLVVLLGISIIIILDFDNNCPLKTDKFFCKLLASDSESSSPTIGILVEHIGLIVGALITLYIAVAAFQRAEALDKTVEEQEKGNFQERYNDAVNQLTHIEPSIRLAGFYGLYYLSQDNKKYSKTICDILCGYVRERTTNTITVRVDKSDKTKNTFYKEKYPREPDNEIQSIIDLLTNKKREESYPFQSEWINLSSAYLVGVNFIGSILNKATLQETQLQGAQLRQAQLQGAQLFRAHLKGAHLQEAQLQEAILFNAQMKGANLSFAEVQGADLQETQMQGAILLFAEMQGANLYKAQLQGGNLSNTQLQGANLSNTKLQGANLSNAQLQGAILSNTKLQGTNLSDAQLQGANLFDAQLQGANLSNTKLQGAILSDAQLQGAILSDAQLQGAILFDAQLQGANLSNTKLQGAILSDAQLQGANLSNAKLQGAYLNEINLQGAFASETFNYISSTVQLKNRIGKDKDLQTAIFSGGVQDKDIKNIKRETKKMPTYLKGSFSKFYEDSLKEELAHLKNKNLKISTGRMKKARQILKKHKKQHPSTTFPPEGYTTISAEDYKKLSEEEQNKEKYIITGILDKATADKTIKELKAVKKEVAKIKKKYSTD